MCASACRESCACCHDNFNDNARASFWSKFAGKTKVSETGKKLKFKSTSTTGGRREAGYEAKNWTIRGDIDETFGNGFSRKVQTALVNMKAPDLLASFPRSAFIRADNSMYQPVLDVGRKIGILRQ